MISKNSQNQAPAYQITSVEKQEILLRCCRISTKLVHDSLLLRVTTEADSIIIADVKGRVLRFKPAVIVVEMSNLNGGTLYLHYCNDDGQQATDASVSLHFLLVNSNLYS